MKTNPFCQLTKTSHNDKEKAYHAFKKAHTLITTNQNNTFSEDFMKGFQCLLTAVSLDKTQPKYFSFLGDTYNLFSLNSMMKSKLLALDSYYYALALDDSLNEVKIKVAIIYINDNMYLKALDYFESAVDASSMYLQPNILSWMNIAYITSPQTSRGIAFYSALLNKYPQADILYIYKAILLNAQHNKKEAGKTLLKVISNPKANQKTIDIAYKLLEEIK